MLQESKFNEYFYFVGIWADDSEDEDGESQMQAGRGGRTDRRSTKDYSKGVNFVSGGVQGGKKDKVKKEKSDSDNDIADGEPKRGFGFAGENYSSESEEEIKPIKQKKELQPQTSRSHSSQGFAGMRKFDGNPALSTKGKDYTK